MNSDPSVTPITLTLTSFAQQTDKLEGDHVVRLADVDVDVSVDNGRVVSDPCVGVSGEGFTAGGGSARRLETLPVTRMRRAGVNYAGVNYAGVNYAGVNYAGVNYAGVNYAGVNSWPRGVCVVRANISTALRVNRC